MRARLPRRTRILYICDFNAHGGTQTHLLHLMSGLERDRFEPALAAPNLHPDLARRLEAAGLRATDLRLKGALRVSTARAVATLVRRARREADLLHGYLHTGNVLAAIVSTASGVPCLTSVRNVDLGKGAWGRTASVMAHRRARRVVFNSAAVRDITLRRERIPAARVVVIPNAVADPGAGTRPGTEAMPGRGPVAICVASLRMKKGHRHLLEAFARVASRVPGARLQLVGEGPLLGTIEEAVREAGLDRSVELLGYRADAVDLMKRADLFVLSSLEEGMPNALIEAMATGLPCVVTAVGGNPEIVEEGVTGFLVPAADPAALAERVVTLLTEPDRRRRMGEAARRRFESVFTLPRMIASYEDLYDGLSRAAGSSR